MCSNTGPSVLPGPGPEPVRPVGASPVLTQSHLICLHYTARPANVSPLAAVGAAVSREADRTHGCVFTPEPGHVVLRCGLRQLTGALCTQPGTDAGATG